MTVHATHPSSGVRCAEFMPRAQRATFTAASSSWWAISAALAAWAGSRLQSKTVEVEVQLELLPAAVALLLLAVMVPESPQFLSAVGRDKVRLVGSDFVNHSGSHSETFYDTRHVRITGSV